MVVRDAPDEYSVSNCDDNEADASIYLKLNLTTFKLACYGMNGHSTANLTKQIPTPPLIPANIIFD